MVGANKHKRARAHIVRFLESEGQANTVEIQEYLNSVMKKHQPTMMRLANILARYPEFNKVGIEKIMTVVAPLGTVGYGNVTRPITIWELNPGAEPWKPLRCKCGHFMSPGQEVCRSCA